jgi:predicted ATPase
LLDNPECRLLTLIGPGGIGKTRLALSIAERKVDVFTNGAWFVTLAPLQSIEYLVPTIAGAIRLNLSVRGDHKTQLINYLHSKNLLLVLDNFEHLVNGATLVSDILKVAPDVRVLVTSRERLNLREEFLFRLEGLTYPIEDDTGTTDGFSAVQLFLERARRLGSQLVFSKDDYAAVARICRLVQGLPLAVELAAGWTRLLSCQEIAREMEGNLGILAISTRDAPERHSSMRAVFDHSWKFLSEQEQVVLRQLSVFRGGFTRATAEQVSGASLGILSTLADKSLLQISHRLKDTQRYDLHELVRQYAHERLLESGEMDVVRERHLEFFLHLSEEAELKLHGPEQIDWLNRMIADHDTCAQPWHGRYSTTARPVYDW